VYLFLNFAIHLAKFRKEA